MAGRSESMTTDDRVFKTVSDTKLTKLSDTGFDGEKPMQEMIQQNLGIMFGLEFLKSEFKVDNGVYWLDTLAFDREANTFVIIEYKNTLKEGVLNQAKAYLNYMKDRRDALTLAYNEEKKPHRNKTEFKWKAAYAIVVAPEFSKYQIDSAKDAKDLELYRIKRYGDGTIIISRAGGAHERVPAPPENGNGHSKHNGDIDAAEKNYLDKKDASDATKTVWHKLKERVQSELADVRFDMPWYGGGFYLPNRRLVCWITVKSDRVELSWNIKEDQEIQTGDFIIHHATWKDGTREYRTFVDTAAHIENAVRVIHSIYDLKSK